MTSHPESSFRRRGLFACGCTLAAPLGLALALSTCPAVQAAPQSDAPHTLKLSSGTQVELREGQRVKLRVKRGAKVESVEGEVALVTPTRLTLVLADGKKSVVEVRSIVTLQTVGDGPAPSAPEGGAGASATAPTDPAVAGSTATAAAAPAPGSKADGLQHVFIIPMDGMVGTGLRHDEIEKVATEADKYGDGQIIVLHIKSGGGLVIEGDDIHDSLMRIKQHHRLVSWIDEAISGAAFTGLHADEIYFTPYGSLGSITMYAGAESIKGAQLAAWEQKCFEVGEIGGRWGHIIRCMVHSRHQLSYDKDADGNVTWYDTLEGQYDLSTETQNLSFTSEEAEDSGFSDGTAATAEELFTLMGLVDGTYVVNDEGQQIARDWQATLKKAKEEAEILKNRYGIAGTATGDPVKVLQGRLQVVEELIRWLKKVGERTGAVELGMSVKDLEKERESLRRQLREAREQQENAGR